MTNYQSGAAFRRALEDRLANQGAKTQMPLVRLRKLVVFDRFLARLAQLEPDTWLSKGGLVLQLRLSQHARTTKDMDILSLIARDEVPQILTRAALLDLQDWFSFAVQPDTAVLPGPGHDGLRFFVTALVAGRTFESFHIDVGNGDPVIESAEKLETPPLLAFAGIPPVTVPCYPLTQHLAEKVHAYVRPRAPAASCTARTGTASGATPWVTRARSTCGRRTWRPSGLPAWRIAPKRSPSTRRWRGADTRSSG